MLLPFHRCSSCGRLVQATCPHCRKTKDRARPNATDRGYASKRWRKFRAVQLLLEPLCRMCQTEGRITAADCVDHIRPVRGPDDVRFLDYAAVQSLCNRCHSKKTARENPMIERA
jgi:5-methylcytosine-specific restriction endonuclease McrA